MVWALGFLGFRGLGHDFKGGFISNYVMQKRI